MGLIETLAISNAVWTASIPGPSPLWVVAILALAVTALTIGATQRLPGTAVGH